ncbi:MAG: molybdopterin-binding protein, partial [Halobacteria archaeon]|nr:molybdopterin-binding protein [Halobacteria archaeon]
MNISIVNVGDEILAGDTVNTNATWLAERLDERGAEVKRIVVIPDEVDVIASTVREHSQEYDAVIVTGGLGPTHDDVTMDGVARAFGKEVRESQEALRAIRKQYSNKDLAEKTAHLPEGSRPLTNSVGVAPGCVIENVFVLPGVPKEMKKMFELIEDQFGGQERHTAFLRTETPESEMVDLLEEVQDRFGVTV